MCMSLLRQWLRSKPLTKTNPLSPDSCTYRVEFVERIARVQCFGIPIDPAAMFEEETVLSIEDLPDWITRRVAVLCTMPYEPPADTEFVKGIGRRIAKYVYWIFHEGEDDGTNTREES